MPGFPTPPGQPLDDLVRQLDDYRRRLEVLERPPDRIRETGTAPTTAVPILPNGGATASSGAFRPGTTSSSYFELWRGDFYSVGATLAYDVTVAPNVATMSWRILVGEVGVTGAVLLEETGITVAGQRGGTLDLSLAALVSGTDPLGRFMSMRIEAKRTAGSGTVDIAVNAAPLIS